MMPGQNVTEITIHIPIQKGTTIPTHLRILQFRISGHQIAINQIQNLLIPGSFYFPFFAIPKQACGEYAIVVTFYFEK